MNKSGFVIRGIATVLIPATLLLTIFPGEQVLAQDCEGALARAEQHYNSGRFDSVIQTLETCLPDKIRAEDKSAAYRLLSLTYLAKDYLKQAQQSIRKLLELVPNWQPDPIQDPPPFTRMVEEVRKEMANEAQEAAELARKAEEALKAERARLAAEKAAEQKATEEATRKRAEETAQKQKQKKAKETKRTKESQEQGGSKAFLWIGLGAVAVGGGLVAALAGGGGAGSPNGSDRLPDPPGGPSGN